MNQLRRICHSLTGLQRRGVLLASTVVLAADPPIPPPGWHQHPPPLPAHTHTAVAGGMPNWQITLITIIGPALLAGAVAVLVRRARVARGRATAHAARTMTTTATAPHRSRTG